VVFLVGADEIAVEPGAFVVFVGSHGDRGAHRADVILPGAAYTEKSGTYVNTEGRVQMSDRAAFPPGEAREEWAIFRALSAALGKPLPFDSLAQLRAGLYAYRPWLARIDAIATSDPACLASLPAGSLGQGALVSAISDFYLTNPIARASRVMGECSALAKARRTAQAAE
jgi:NADH-quinone oxidoreductase subunit G